MDNISKIWTTKLDLPKTAEALKVILSNRKSRFFADDIIKLQTLSKLSGADYYQIVFSLIVYGKEKLSEGYSSIENKNSIDFKLAVTLSDTIILPLMVTLSNQSIESKMDVLQGFFNLYKKICETKPGSPVARYWVNFNKWETLELTLSLVFAQWAYYLCFNLEAQFISKKDHTPNIHFIDIEQLNQEQLKIFWKWVVHTLKLFYWQMEYLKRKWTKITSGFLEFHLRNDKKFNFFKISSFLFKKGIWTKESFREDWLIEIIKNTHFEWKNNNSIDKIKVLNMFMKWNPNNNNP